MNKIIENAIIIILGDNNTIFKSFGADEEELKYLKDNDNRVGIGGGSGLFAEEWEEWVDFDESYAFIKDGKLNIIIYGIPDHINEKSVTDYLISTVNQHLKSEYGEFFETYPGCPLCVNVEHNGKSIIL